MTRREAMALVALASSSYPSIQGKDPRPIVEAWAMMLADLDAVVAKAAIIKVCRESQFFPSVAQIVAAAQELDPRNEKLPTAAEAWEEVVRLIRDFGPYRAPKYSCDTVKRAVRAIGWQQLCMGENPEADRAHFLRLYESMRSRYREDRENEKVLALSGMGEVVRALAGRLSNSPPADPVGGVGGWDHDLSRTQSAGMPPAGANKLPRSGGGSHATEGAIPKGERPPGPGRMSYLPKEIGSHRKAPVRRGVSPIRTAAPL